MYWLKVVATEPILSSFSRFLAIQSMKYWTKVVLPVPVPPTTQMERLDS